MKKNRRVNLRAKLLVGLAILSLVAVPLIPSSALAADSLASRGCATNDYDDNLVKNPSFEDAHAGNSTPYIVYSTPGAVTGWTTLTHYSQMQVVLAANSFNATQFAPNGWSVYDGNNKAVLPSFTTTGGLTAGSQFQGHPGLVGSLIKNYSTPAPTVIGVTYVLSARVSNVSNDLPKYIAGQGSVVAAPVAIEMRLRNSTTHAESAPIQATIPNHFQSGGTPDGHEWGLISGTVTSNQTYDKVVLRHYQDTGYAFIDDVVVCRAPTPTPWWRNHGVQGGLVLFVLGSAGMLFTWHTRGKSGKKGKSSNASHVAVGDFDGDGDANKLKVSESESPRPMNRVLRPGNQLGVFFVVLMVAGAVIFVASFAGGVRTSKTITPDSTPHVTGKSSKKTSAKAKTPAPVKTCTDKETVKEGYKLFRSDKYQYCIQYPMGWPVNSTDPAKVTFGTVPAGEPAAGWLKVTHFSSKTVAMRAEEIMANFKEPAGPCTETTVTLAGESGKKLVCIGAANGENHIFYIVSEEGGNLFELSYIGGNATQNAQYKILVDSFLGDMVASK